MNGAARNPEIPPAPFVKGGGPAAAFSGKKPSSPHAFPPLTKGGKRGFPHGFTLIEVIVTILMAAIMGAFFIQFMGTAMSRSSRSIENVRDEASAEALMEQIVADYVAEINKADPSTALETIRGKDYGTSVSMSYIRFNSSGVEETLISPNTSNTLKVTVGAPGNNLTALFTNSRVAATPPDPTLPPVEF